MNDKPTIVLLVEDNPGDARLLQEALAAVPRGGFRLEHVERLDAALERLSEGGIDVVLLDLSLPDGRGLDTVVRAHAAAPRVPIVVLTGLEDEALAIRALREGAQDYLVKGQVDGDVLARAMRYAVERKRAEEALRESEERYRTLVETSPDAIALMDLETRILMCNRQSAALLGFESSEEMLGRVMVEFIVPEDRSRARNDARKTLQQGSASNIEYTLRRNDGSTFPAEVSSSLIVNSEGEPKALIAVTRDISDRRRADKEKRRLQDELAHAQKMQALGTLAGGVAHEFNNINAAIIGYVDLVLQTERLSETVRKNLEIVRSSAVRGADLTRSLLAFSRKEIGERSPVDLRSVVDEVLRLTQKEFTSEGIEVTVGHSTRVSPVIGDSGLLTHVVMNLVINARHAMLKSAAKRLTVETGQEKERPFVRVRDTGCGIPKEDLPRVFEPFFTTKGSLAGGGIYDGKAHGTGLGLSVCHSIVKGHGGEIKVTSQAGKGTTVTVYLPAATKRKTTRREAAEDPKERSARVLVVDDEDAITDLIVQILGREGYSADGFTDPREAYQALAHRPYSLVFVDLQMPEMTGEDFLERIDRLPPGKRPLKVVLTGRLAGLQEDYTGSDVFATLLKPFSTGQVLEIVRRGFSARSAVAASGVK